MKSSIGKNISAKLKQNNYQIGFIKIPKNISLTPEDELIHELAWFAFSHSQVLADVLTTFQSKESGIELVYGLDFDVISSFINPWLRVNSHSRIIEYFFQKNENRFTLLPGTVEELFGYLKYAERQEKKIDSFTQMLNEKNANKTTIQSIKNLFAELGLGESGKSIDNDLELLSNTLMEVSNRMNFSMIRLNQILNDERLVPLSDLFKNKDKPIYKEDIKTNIFVQLVNARSGENKKNANLSDAKNIATIIEHSKQETESYFKDPDNYSGVYLRLLTTTNCIFKLNIDLFYYDFVGNHIAKTLEAVRETTGHSRAVRSCYEAVYDSIISDRYNNNLHKCREVANSLFIKTQQLTVNINCIHAEIWNLKFGTNQNNERLKKLMKRQVPSFVSDPCYQTMKYLLVQDSYEHSNKIDSQRANNYWWEMDYDNFALRNKKYIGKIERSDLQKVELEYKINSPTNLLKKFGIADETILLENTDLKRWIIYNEFIVPKVELFLLDYYNRIFSASWPSNLEESRIIDLINDLFVLPSNYEIIDDSEGEILLIFENGDRSKKLCDLPLSKKLTYFGYREILNDIEKLNGSDEILPTQIICTSRTRRISFDVYIASNQIPQGIMYSFQDLTYVSSLIILFLNTSIWTSNWIVANDFKNYFEYKLKHILKEWTN